MPIEGLNPREAQVLQRLQDVQARIEHDLAATDDPMLKRIEVSAATIVALTLVNELLPEPVQVQVRELLALHTDIWNADAPPLSGQTPRKPIGRRFLDRLHFS